MNNEKPAENKTTNTAKKQAHATAYWEENLKIMSTLLIIWFSVSFVSGIIAVDALNSIRLGGFKVGFWFAQQGSIYIFVILIFVYVKLMNNLDKKFGFDD